MEIQKYASKLYKPKKPYHMMTIDDLCDHNKVCRSLDKMSLKKINRLENLKPEILDKKIKRFLERNKKNKTKKAIHNNKLTKKRKYKNYKKSKKRNFFKKKVKNSQTKKTNEIL